MEQSPFTARLARALDGPVEAACAVRPPGTTVFAALGAGLGAAVGSIAGGPLLAGLGGGLGVVVGYLVVWLRSRSAGLAVAMALVLRPDRVELLRLNAMGTRPAGVLRTLPYSDVRGVTMRSRLLEMRIEIETPDGVLRLDGGKRGVGAVPPVVEQLSRRRGAEGR
jgi:hypothetical protein